MKKVWIVLEKNKGFVQRCIRWFTKSEVDHVAILYWSDFWQSNFILEAVPSGVKIRPAKDRKFTHKFLVKYNIAPDIRLAVDKIGQPYDFVSLLAFGWLILCWRYLKIKAKYPWKDAYGQFCSELVGRIMKRNKDICLPESQWVSPEDILRECRQLSIFEEIKG